MKDFVPHHLPDHMLPHTIIDVEADRVLSRRVAPRVVQPRHVRMLERLRHGDPLPRVEHKHPLQQVHGQGIGLRVQPGEVGPPREGQRLDVPPGLEVVDELDVLLPLAPQRVDDQLQLVEALRPGEHGLPPEDLGEDAAHGPDVDRGPVVVAREQQLGGAVPARDHVLGHKLPVALAGPREPEVAYLQVAVGVHQEVSGLEVAVKNIGRVEIFQPSQ